MPQKSRTSTLDARGKTPLDAIAPQSGRLLPGEFGYKSMCIQEVVYKINKFFEGTNEQPPSRKTIEGWVYKQCMPSWAIAVIVKN